MKNTSIEYLLVLKEFIPQNLSYQILFTDDHQHRVEYKTVWSSPSGSCGGVDTHYLTILKSDVISKLRDNKINNILE